MAVVVLKRTLESSDLVLMVFGSQSNVCFYRHDKLQKNYLAILIEYSCKNT